MLLFEWDVNKNLANIQKHGVDFLEAESAFKDDYSLFIPDPEHSDEEDRNVLIGLSEKGNELMVVHCYRNDEEIIRIISVRKATKNEEKVFYERR